MSEKGNIYDARTRLSQLVERDEIVIARRGHPGRMRGRIRIAGDFDAPLPSDFFDRNE